MTDEGLSRFQRITLSREHLVKPKKLRHHEVKYFVMKSDKRRNTANDLVLPFC